jgi:hypothetical protein
MDPNKIVDDAGKTASNLVKGAGDLLSAAGKWIKDNKIVEKIGDGISWLFDGATKLASSAFDGISNLISGGNSNQTIEAASAEKLGRNANYTPTVSAQLAPTESPTIPKSSNDISLS